MRRLLIFIAAALVACVAAATALADTGTSSQQCTPRVYAFAGSATAIGSNSITVRVVDGYGDDEGISGHSVMVNVNASTRIQRDGKEIQLSDLVQGEHVAVSATGCRGEGPNQTFTAKLIRAGDRELSLSGSVVSVGTSSLTVEVDHKGPPTDAATAALVGKQLTVAVTPATKITRDGKPIQLSDLVTGEHVLIRVHAVGSQYTAVSIRASNHDIRVAGTITAVGTTTLTLEVERSAKNASELEGKPLTFTVDSSTRILLNGRPAQLSDLKNGDQAAVHAQGVAGQYTAIEIRARAPEAKPSKPAHTTTTTTTTTTSASATQQ